MTAKVGNVGGYVVSLTAVLFSHFAVLWKIA